MKTNIKLWLSGLLFAGLLASQDAHAFYNAATGRWLSRDPVEEGRERNLYAASLNELVGRFDFLGLKTIVLVAGFDSSAEPNSRSKRILEKERRSLIEMLIKCVRKKDCDCPDAKGVAVELHFDDTKDKPAPSDGEYDLTPGASDVQLKAQNLEKVHAKDVSDPTLRVLATKSEIYQLGATGRAATDATGTLLSLKLSSEGYYQVLAHELGHFAGYDRPDNRDDPSHAPDSEWRNLMVKGGGDQPDCQWCQKVSNLAK